MGAVSQGGIHTNASGVPKWRRDSGASMFLPRLGRSVIAPIRPSGTFPRKREKGAAGWSVALQPTDHMQPGCPSPASGRRWRAAPDEGNTINGNAAQSGRCAALE
ncbi:hypothetical protein M3O57_07870 [Xanthomonas nasturtii]|uniref:hypothetical protein n=1 Tax=Xanthomonas nasturtii TaxID=1843581 RepID=UPI0011C05630|nr:hypothetical protein [Xanthomonas nasturtii]MCL1530294.1 hypothetical protein [Xanthomonas nasturtii]MCL1565440.1 hypothetical protein [Xanthomonas nasturtii]MCL1569382.1 hypothetical protein [Xanthomonas nasturtii]MCL1573208.1 hypothetical protein [Xanthomonas nasturtii]MCL1580620.1 hypothetical protein [Xanthomonas nasturtii]